MEISTIIQSVVIVALLAVGTWVNRNTSVILKPRVPIARPISPTTVEAGRHAPTSEDELPEQLQQSSPTERDPLLPLPQDQYHTRTVKIFGWEFYPKLPSTGVCKNSRGRRFLLGFPFAFEVGYLALLFLGYLLVRAFTAWYRTDTVTGPHEHAKQIKMLERKWHIFLQSWIQKWSLKHPLLMTCTDKINSFIHVPGMVIFLVWLFYYTTKSYRNVVRQTSQEVVKIDRTLAGPQLYEARRRTMALCTLITLLISAIWPSKPPRLALSDTDIEDLVGLEAPKHSFIDTIRGDGRQRLTDHSVWIHRFRNQYASLPSLHFSYSLLIGITIVFIPLAPHQVSRPLRWSIRSYPLPVKVATLHRILCIIIGVAYPLVTFLAMVATGRHYFLDIVAAVIVFAAAWYLTDSLVILEDYFLFLLHIHKPNYVAIAAIEDSEEEEEYYAQFPVGRSEPESGPSSSNARRRQNRGPDSARQPKTPHRFDSEVSLLSSRTEVNKKTKSPISTEGRRRRTKDVPPPKPPSGPKINYDGLLDEYADQPSDLAISPPAPFNRGQPSGTGRVAPIMQIGQRSRWNPPGPDDTGHVADEDLPPNLWRLAGPRPRAPPGF